MAYERLTSYNGAMELLTQTDIPLNRGKMFNLLKVIPFVKKVAWLNESSRISLLELIHSHYKYQKNNVDLFINLQEKLYEANEINSGYLTNLETKKLETREKNDNRESD